MLATILNAFQVADIRKKIAFTAAMLLIYRLGSHVPVPGVNLTAVNNIQSQFGGSNILGLLNLFSGGGLSRIAIFALGIMPYITASIILQLLQVAVPSLEKLSKEGEVGQARITQYTRYLTVRLPAGIQSWCTSQDQVFKVIMPFLVLAVVAGIVFVQEGQRRIPIQYAKRVIGRRMTEGGQTYLPLRVNMAGVIPVIFAASIMAFLPTVGQLVKTHWGTKLSDFFSPNGWRYVIGESIFIIIFTYFYTAVTFNPVDQADNLKKYGGFIPGVRPGRPTAEFLDRILARLTFPGALFLAAVAALPTILIARTHQNIPLGGTSLLIVIGVALETMKQLEAQLMMRSYEGFLK